jgi:hypothetical protein
MMTRSYVSNYHDLTPYIPGSVSEIHDLVSSMVLDAPTFVDETGYFPDRNIDSRFHQLVESFGAVRRKLGEEHYARLIDLAARAKAFFVDDPADSNGKADEGRALLYEMEDVLGEIRSKRVKAKLKDGKGEIAGN